MKQEGMIIQPYTFKELAALYRCSTKTYRKWLQQIVPEIGRRTGRCYTQKQVRIIVERLGEP